MENAVRAYDEQRARTEKAIAELTGKEAAMNFIYGAINIAWGTAIKILFDEARVGRKSFFVSYNPIIAGWPRISLASSRSSMLSSPKQPIPVVFRSSQIALLFPQICSPHPAPFSLMKSTFF